MTADEAGSSGDRRDRAAVDARREARPGARPGARCQAPSAPEARTAFVLAVAGALVGGLLLGGCMAVSRDAPESSGGGSAPPSLEQLDTGATALGTTAARPESLPEPRATTVAEVPATEPTEPHPAAGVEPGGATGPKPPPPGTEPLAIGPAGREPHVRDPRRPRADGPELLGASGLFAEGVASGAGSTRPPLYVVCLDGDRTFEPPADERRALAEGAGEPAWLIHAALAGEPGPLDPDRLVELARAAGAHGLALVRFGGDGRSRRLALALVELDTARPAASHLDLEPSFEVAGAAIRRHLLGGR